VEDTGYYDSLLCATSGCVCLLLVKFPLSYRVLSFSKDTLHSSTRLHSSHLAILWHLHRFWIGNIHLCVLYNLSPSRSIAIYVCTYYCTRRKIPCILLNSPQTFLNFHRERHEQNPPLSRALSRHSGGLPWQKRCTSHVLPLHGLPSTSSAASQSRTASVPGFSLVFWMFWVSLLQPMSTDFFVIQYMYFVPLCVYIYMCVYNIGSMIDI